MKGEVMEKMKSKLTVLLLVLFSTGLLIPTALAKPDKVDGFNVPSGRIPQEIKNNRYPRTYYPNTEKLNRNAESVSQ
jgi:hypothetical protein